MTITLDRAWKKPAYTISRLLVDGVRFCEALEDTDRGLEKSMKGRVEDGLGVDFDDIKKEETDKKESS